jgi:hypothetical protein
MYESKKNNCNETGLALATLFTGCTSNNSTERTLEQRLEVRQETSTPRNVRKNN